MFKDFLSFFKATDSAEGKKKVSPFIILLCSVIIIVPTAIALFHAYFHSDSTVVTNNYIELVLYNPQGEQIASEELIEANVSNSPFASVFYDIIRNKEVSQASLNDASPNFKLYFKYNGTPEEYFCYFTESHSRSYLKDASGNIFSVEEISYNAFLNSEFSQDVYASSQPPCLITGDGEFVSPNSATWFYYKQNKEPSKAIVNLSSSDNMVYNISGAINLHFERAPSTCVAQIYDHDGKIIFEGSLSDLAFVKPQTDTRLSAKVTATWENEEGCSSYGQITYAFDIILGNKAEFSISKSQVTAGDFIILSVKNVQSLSKIIYSTSNKANRLQMEALDDLHIKQFDLLCSYIPTFVADGDTSRAIIPFPADLPTGNFNFSISYGATEQNFTIEIQERADNTFTFSRPSADIASILSSNYSSTLNDIIANVTISPQSLRVFRGQFSSPLDYGFSSGYSFENTVYAQDRLAEFNAFGAEFISNASGGASVRALNIGVVVEADYSPYIGNYVVLDHGMGLRTWYCGLSDFNVKAGDIVAKGDSVGKSGSDWMVSTDGVVIMCTVYNVLVDPATLWNTQFNLDSPDE